MTYMTKIIALNGYEITNLMLMASEADANHRKLRIAVHEDGRVAFKVGEDMWTHPMGKVEKS